MKKRLFALAAITAAAVAISASGGATKPAHAASCSVSKTASTVNVNNQAEGIVSNDSNRPTQVTIGGGTMNWTSGPFGAGGGMWETTWASH